METGFDLERYTRNSRAVKVDDIVWEDVAKHPLTHAEVRFLTYMMNIEAHTIVYHKELLSTKAIHDNEVTAFLACWNYEEYFHGAALERFLKAYVGDGNVANDPGYRLRQDSRLARFGKKLLTPVVSALSPDFVAVHMTWGATQELTTLHGYEQVARQTQHPILKVLMERIVRDERRHFAFYFNQAQRRLSKSPFMQKETRWAMDRLWRPVGVGAMPADDADFSSWYLFRDEIGQACMRTVDETMSRLPGMAGWTGLTTQMNAAIARVNARDDLTRGVLEHRTPTPTAAPHAAALAA